MIKRLKLSKNQLKIAGVIILLLALPIILFMAYQSQNQRSSAATPDKLETEIGVLSSSGVTKQSDSTASGGQFVRFDTSGPIPTIPSGARYIPDSIDSSGNTDVSDQIQSFINSSPDSSTIVFKQGATYNLGERILLWTRNNITLEGNGSALKLTGAGTQISGGIIVDEQSNNIKIQNFKINGNYTLAGTPDSCCSREGHHAIQIYGSDNVLVDNVEIDSVAGDCFYIEPKPATNWPENITIRNSKCDLAGRHGVMVEGGRNILVENSRFDKMGNNFTDMEPGRTEYGADGVTYRNNWIGSYGHTGQFDAFVLGAHDAPWNEEGSSIRNVTFTGNTIEGGISGWHGGALGMQMLIITGGPNSKRENFVLTNNTANITVDGSYFGVFRIFNTNGITFTGNVQPHTGKYLNFQGSTNIISDVPY